ncbi:META domain-containing protein [Flavobacteriaceae bacterium XHP0103]|uniref:META domain-containing protein n=1 Tax=Marixanthotalea marina TaxID=2844359 RepID=UPI00298A0430|nr:META domain-containing protein [Marixanthotalea marina]MBU3821525.1 META domain-containing protein [Marixanthotalea marina]
MKPLKSIFIMAVLCTIIGCQSSKSLADKLYNTTWELEYIPGPRIAFNGLFPNKKPQITFNKDTNNVEGNNGCNGYLADYTLNENNISFGEPGPTTMMYCGEGEKVFLKTMKQVNKFRFDEEGKLNLMLDDVDMMRFKKVE